MCQIVLFGLLLVQFSLTLVRAQFQGITTNVTCSYDYAPLANLQGQNPCLIAAYLQAACTPSDSWNVPVLPPGKAYNSPNSQSANYCSCSSVVYSLISACAACQGAHYNEWEVWIAACPGGIVTVGQWPLDIPQNTSIPHWAYQDVTTSGSFNLQQAISDQGAASTYPGTPTASVNFHPGSTGAPSSESFGKSHSGLGGGVIAGIAIAIVGVIAVVAIIVFLFLRRHRRRHSHISRAQIDLAHEMDEAVPRGPSLVAPRPLGAPRLYNPDNPATFPEVLAFDIDGTPSNSPPPKSVVTPIAYGGAVEPHR